MKKVRLGDICSKIGSGATPRGGSEVYLESGIAFIRSQNVYNEGFKRDGLAFISWAHADELENVAVEEGDILLNITGDSVARACQAPTGILPARVNQHVAIIRPDASLLDPRFLRYYLVGPSMQQRLFAFAGAGATRDALTKAMIESLEIVAPGIEGQRAIASMLGALDDKIELNRRMNATLEAIARAIFKSWFVDRNSVPAYQNSGWQSGRFGDLAENPRDQVAPEDVPAETPYIGLEHMPRKSIALSEWGLSGEVSSNKFAFRVGDVLFGKLRPYFHKVGVAAIDGVCSTDILVVRPKDPRWFSFALGHVSSSEMVGYANAGSTGTKMPRTNWDELSRFEISIPPSELALQFNTIMMPLIQKIQASIHESRTLRSVRDALLPRLMSSEIQIQKAEKMVEART